MDQSSTPRVSCPYLNSYVGRNVLVVGKVVQVRGDSAVLDADGHITVNLNKVRLETRWCPTLILPTAPPLTFWQDARLVGGNAAQVVGKVMPDLSIKVLSAQDLGVDVGTFSMSRHTKYTSPNGDDGNRIR